MKRSLLLIFLLSVSFASPSSVMFRKAPAVRELYVTGRIEIFPREEREMNHLFEFTKNRVGSDLFSSLPAHILCTFQLSTTKLRNILEGGEEGRILLTQEAVENVQAYAKNPPIGYRSSRDAMEKAVERAASFMLFQMNEGKALPDSAFESLQRAAEIVSDYGLSLYFVDACATRSRQTNTLNSVMRLTEMAIDLAENAPDAVANLRPILSDRKESIELFELAEALQFAKEKSPESWPLLKLKSQFVDESGYEGLKKEAYEKVLLSKGMDEKAADLLRKGDYEGFRASFSESERVEKEKLNIFRTLLCQNDGFCRLFARVENPNPFQTRQSVLLYEGRFEDASFPGFRVGNKLMVDVDLNGGESEVFVGSFWEGVK